MEKPCEKNKIDLIYRSIVISVVIFFMAGIFSSTAKESGAETNRATQLVHRFFTLVHRGNYEEAYDCFSKSIQREVSFLRFRQGARDIKYLKILSIKVLDEEENLIKMNINALLHVIYDGHMYEAVYEGKIDVYKEKDQWKVVTVDLRATDQKALGEKADPEQLQRIDFGTTSAK